MQVFSLSCLWARHCHAGWGQQAGVCRLQDLNGALDRIRGGEPIESLLTPPMPVASHVLDDDMDSDDEAEDDAAAEPTNGKSHGGDAPSHKVEA